MIIKYTSSSQGRELSCQEKVIHLDMGPFQFFKKYMLLKKIQLVSLDINLICYIVE